MLAITTAECNPGGPSPNGLITALSTAALVRPRSACRSQRAGAGPLLANDHPISEYYLVN